MSDVFKSKVRKVGTSLGILIPRDVIDSDKIKEGEEIEISLLKKRRIDDVMKLFGSAKGAKPFERDKNDRVDRWGLSSTRRHG